MILDYMEKIDLQTGGEIELLDITSEVSKVVKSVKSGICTVFTKHTTTGIIINENETGLRPISRTFFQNRLFFLFPSMHHSP